MVQASKQMKERPAGWSRRDFLRTSTLAGAAAFLGSVAARGQSAFEGPKADEVNVAVIGAGAQGRVLIESCLNIPGVRFRAVCDIWSYSQRYASRYLLRYDHEVNVYEDYREMLEKEKGLDAVIVASPDWMHAEHANACLQAGLHVYCEKEMSNSLEEAASMVRAARETGRLLQIGHQRRSNPRYLHAVDTLMTRERLLGRITNAYGQWNRSKAASEALGWPKQYEIDAATLARYGYASMQEFRNWRWYRKYGGGPIVDLGSQQIDIFAWVFGGPPRSVTADGGRDFFPEYEWYDNVMAVYEFEGPEGPARALYQVLTTTSHGGFGETFMGVDGSIEISEVPQRGNAAMREPSASDEKWNELARRGLLERVVEPLTPSTSKNVELDVRVTVEAGQWPLPVELAKPAHQPHLENFFNAIRHGEPLNCPPEIGYETAVMTLRTNDAVEAHRRIVFKPEDFTV